MEFTFYPGRQIIINKHKNREIMSENEKCYEKRKYNRRTGSSEVARGWVVVVQSLSCVQLFVTPWTQHARLPCPSLSSEFALTRVHGVSDAIQPSHALLPPSILPSIFPSIRVFSNELALPIRWPKYWSFSISISPSNEHSGLISSWKCGIQ